MTVSMLNPLFGSAGCLHGAERIAQRRAGESAQNAGFSAAMSQANAGSSVNLIGGQPNNVLIPMELLLAGAEEKIDAGSTLPGAEKLKSDGPADEFLEFARKPAEEKVPVAAAKSDDQTEKLRKLDEVRIAADLRQELEAGLEAQADMSDLSTSAM